MTKIVFCCIFIFAIITHCLSYYLRINQTLPIKTKIFEFLSPGAEYNLTFQNDSNVIKPPFYLDNHGNLYYQFIDTLFSDINSYKTFWLNIQVRQKHYTLKISFQIQVFSKLQNKNCENNLINTSKQYLTVYTDHLGDNATSYYPAGLLSNSLTSCHISNFTHILSSNHFIVEQKLYDCYADNIFLPNQNSIIEIELVSINLKDGKKSANPLMVYRNKRSVAMHFVKNNFVKHINENIPNNTQVALIPAYDQNNEVVSGVKYELEAMENQFSLKLFKIDQHGRITTNGIIDREKMSRHVFRVTATLAATQIDALLTIMVDDLNDHIPQFILNNGYKIKIEENQPLNSYVQRINAIDYDSGINSKIHYSISRVIPVSGRSIFAIRQDGSLLIQGKVDREKQSYYNLTIRASDRGSPSLSNTIDIYVEIEDRNDNTPQFSKSRYITYVKEGVAIGTVIGSVSASDSDAGTNGEVSYSFIRGNSFKKFSLNSRSGNISVIKPLDYEKNDNTFTLTIRASDGGLPPLTNTTTIKIIVTDINDNSPHFHNLPYEFSVDEDVSINYEIGYVEADDQDSGENSKITYSIVQASPQIRKIFRINHNTGAILLSQKLDYEKTKQYEFSIRATDRGKDTKYAQTDVIIHVQDVNDNPPQFESKQYQQRIAEDTRINSEIIKIKVFDPDKQKRRIKFSITAGDSEKKFSILTKGNLGIIKLSKQLDYIEQSIYKLTVTASDGELVNSTVVIISITDTNSHQPIFEETTYTASIKEDVRVGAFVIKVHANDSDIGENAKITYCFTNPVSDFSINETTGDIQTTKILDYEKKPLEILYVKAQDHGLPPKYDETTVKIYLEDSNDNSPQFDKPLYKGSISEDSNLFSEVLQIHATDKDSDFNSQIYYTFSNGYDGNGDFDIDRQNGIIRTARRLDRETIDQYNLIAYAVDKGSPPLSSSVSVLVNVIDVDDNAPHFLNVMDNKLTFHVKEDVKPNQIIAKIKAVDPDLQSNSAIRYDLGDDPILLRQWSLDPITGDLKTLNHLDYETQTSYNFTVTASSNNLINKVDVQIIVDDCNDNQPIFKNFEIIFNNYRSRTKHTFPHGAIGTVPAYDLDVSDKLTYRFVFGNEENLLIMNKTTGELRLSPLLNSNRQFQSDIGIQVSDGKFKTKATCTLKVVGINEEMLQHSITVRVLHMNAFNFLSPKTISRFSTGLAKIFNISNNNVYVFNVQNDTDVILNVSFSVKKDFHTFFNSTYLQDQIYLNRQTLVHLIGKNVLPFDDNICLREPCLNYKRCTSVLTFNSSAPFISSPSIIFRPIYPVYKLKCECPIGFTNNETCADEIDLCYSNPCLNGGSCAPMENHHICSCPDHYTGQNCEINLRNAKCSAYPFLCKNGGVCQDESESLSCDCAALRLHSTQKEDTSITCELLTRSFSPGSFLMLPGITKQWHFTIHISFSTIEKNGLIFYNGRLNHQHDFLALQLINGQVQLNFSTGSSWSVVDPFVRDGLNDGKWHTIEIKYYNQPTSEREALPQGVLNRRGPSSTKIVTLTIDPMTCDNIIASNWNQKYGNYSCSKQVKQTSLKKSLDLTSPLLLGGVPDLPEHYQVRFTSYSGCLSNLMVDGKKIDLAQFVANNGSSPGCRAMRNQCTPFKCSEHGTCKSKWNGYECICDDKYTGQRCEHVNDFVISLSGRGCVQYTHTSSLPIFQLPWSQRVSFRTFNRNAVLVYLVFDRQETLKLTLQISDGYLLYSLVLPSVARNLLMQDERINDGGWHDVEIEWSVVGSNIRIEVTVDQRYTSQTYILSSLLEQMRVKLLYVGGKKIGSGRTSSPFTGCLQDIQISSPRQVYRLSTLYLKNVDGGAFQQRCIADGCQNHRCPRNSVCVQNWTRYHCKCKKGFIGDDCVSACTLPLCQHGGSCLLNDKSESGYKCLCPPGFLGKLCERELTKSCPTGWYGKGICAPCNCSSLLNFDQTCNPVTGYCSCKRHHYYNSTLRQCFPCDCYNLGSLDLQCNNVTGQCRCKSTVGGKHCTTCTSKYAEVTNRGCNVVYINNICPQSYFAGIEWPRTTLGEKSPHKCPVGSHGIAYRLCTDRQLWSDPDFSNCTSDSFNGLAFQLYKIKSEKELLITKSIPLSFELLDVTTNIPRYQNDVIYTSRMIEELLGYESKVTGFDLAASAEQRYTENLVHATSSLLTNQTIKLWKELESYKSIKRLSASPVTLMESWESYMSTILSNLNVIHCNISSSITPNMELVMKVVPRDVTSNGDFIYKYHESEDDDRSLAEITLPSDLLVRRSHRGNSSKRVLPTVGVIAYRNMDRILPLSFADDRTFRRPRNASVNSAVVAVQMHRGEISALSSDADLRDLPVPLTIKFRLLNPKMIDPQCVFWNYTARSTGSYRGGWSNSRCNTEYNDTHVICQCFHMTTFAVVSDKEVVSVASAIPVLIFMSIFVTISVVLFLAFIISSLVFKLKSVRITIARNLSWALLLAALMFIVGVQQTSNIYLCMSIAISIHFLLLSAFAWMFVDGLHMYRKLTEERDVNRGKTRIYYIVGWIVPFIITALSVGLDAKGYGNSSFCMVSMEDVLIWSVAGPVLLCTAGFVVFFIMSVHAFLSLKITDTKRKESSYEMRTSLFVSISVILGSVFATLAVNFNVQSYFFIFALSCFAQALIVTLFHGYFNTEMRKAYKRFKTRSERRTMLNTTAQPLIQTSIAMTPESSAGRAVLRVNMSTSDSVSIASNKTKSPMLPVSYGESDSDGSESSDDSSSDSSISFGSSSDDNQVERNTYRNIQNTKPGNYKDLPLRGNGRLPSNGSAKKGAQLSVKKKLVIKVSSGSGSDGSNETAV